MWIDKLERRFGRYAIPNLMRYIIFGSVIVYIIGLFQPMVIYQLALIPELVMKGQVWRLFSFIFVPTTGNNILVAAISFYFYYWIGGALEASWGAFRFNLYYLIGVVAIIIASFVFQTTGIPAYLYQTMFLALASLYPDQRVLFMYFIPMKAIWVALIGALGMVYDFFVTGSMAPGIRWLILASLVNYIVFFLPVLWQRIKNKQRRSAYERKIHPQGMAAAPRKRPNQSSRGPASGYAGKSAADRRGDVVKRVPFHRCHVCGITDVDDPNMTFRYCSQCNGNYEYCENHLHNHEHVQ